MMQLLNIILLSLSIATVLLTLVSYFLYKMKQLPKNSRGKAETRRLEGVFFRRYLPPDPSVPEASPPTPSAPQSRWKVWIPRTTSSFFFVVTGVIFLALVGQYLINRADRGDLMSARERNELMAQGLLKHYKLGNLGIDRVMDEFIFPQQKARLEALITKLKAKRIVLVQTAANRSEDRRQNRNGLESWAGFLEANGIPFRTAKDLSAVKPGIDLAILPHPAHLGKSERDDINLALENRIAFLATGGVAVGDGRPDVNASEWTGKTFGIQLISNPTPANRYPTLFSAGVAPWWEIPSGIEAAWFPADALYKAIAIGGSTALYEGDYKGFFNGIEGYSRVTEVTRAQYVSAKRARAVWLALDPNGAKTNDLTEAEVFYVRAALIHSLAWAAGIPSARIASYKQGRKAAMVVWVDTEDKFENILAMADTFKQHDFPATYFVVSDLFKEHPEMMRHMTPSMEIESHSENHKTFYLQQLEEQFDRLQVTRHQIERITKKPVIGFRPPTEKCGADTVNAAIQNGLKYIAGDRTFMRYSPTWIASGKLVFFSRTLHDDISLKRAGLMEEPEDLVATVAAQADHVGKLHGVYLLGLHTQNFGEGPQLEGLARSLEVLDVRKYWKTNFGELYDWSKVRIEVEAELAPDDGGYRVTVSNPGDTALLDFGIELDAGTSRRFALADRPLASDATAAKLDQGGDFPLLVVGRLDPKQTLTFLLVDSEQ